MTDRNDIAEGNVWGCDRCEGPHTTEQHDAKLLERIAAETAQYNRDVLGAE